ncbi:uncharacterized protein LOC133987151 [Scomber scombrus]|uniref:uncharacterized protein LOC133987151 n=1 Tax=Scomber scombrus TaxID=13677 RepID=UPI002DD9E778|nr:uncharacterized protein LOC133987151 [Scomber scombrus]
MAGLCWVVVGLAVFLSAENCLAAVDQNKLARIVDAILKEYGRHAMFSLAIRIPDNQNQNINQILKQVFKSDPGNDVKKKINNGEVYIGSRVIAAKVLKRSKGSTDNAESRVVDHLYHFTNRCNPNTKDMLLFYVYSSPCVEQRSNRHNILRRIKNIQRWNSFAVVFSGIYRPRDGLPSTDQQRRGALQLLGMSIGLNNIFRCHGPCGRMKCSCCSCGTQVVDYCVLDDTKLSTASIQPNGSNRKNNFGQGGSGKGVGMGRPRWGIGIIVNRPRWGQGRRAGWPRWRIRGRLTWPKWRIRRRISWPKWRIRIKVRRPKWKISRRVCWPRWRIRRRKSELAQVENTQSLQAQMENTHKSEKAQVENTQSLQAQMENTHKSEKAQVENT